MQHASQTITKNIKTAIIGIVQLYFFASLILPALIPSGLMLSRDNEGNFVELTVCSATNHRKVLMNLDTGAVVDIDATSDAAMMMAETLPAQSGPPDIDELPSYQNELCPFSQATADQVITPELQFRATHLPADRALLQIITLRFDETKHRSLPARGPPSLS
jgi:hypothetical protein